MIDLDAVPHPAIVHWGEELTGSTEQTLRSLAVAARPQRVSGGLDEPARATLVATPAGGWLGTPGLEGHRDGASFSVRLELVGVAGRRPPGRLALVDREARLSAQLELRVGTGGLFHQRITLRNTGDSPYTLQHLHLAFPVPWDATEILDTTGRHLRERSPQRHPFGYGTYLRESRRGRPGADATLVLAAGRPGFGFERGRVHAVHVAWSGNHRLVAERSVTGEAFLAGGELFAPGEVVLAPGASLTSPEVIGSWGDGLSELAHRFHDEWRRRPAHPRRPRPITLNTWEAVYFDHSLERLTALADAAASVGVERFVLDDGWFVGRRDDTAGLGDWYVDATVWPDGLHPLVDHVLARGMEFGLWVEPEMVNPDSDLARRHPDWILRARMALPPSARQQQVLDLAHADAYAYIAARLHALLDEYPIAYLKWDHNRDLLDAGSGPEGVARVREHTLALYRLLDELKAAPPRAGDRELRLRGRARRPRHPGPHRPDLDQRHPRPARAPGEPAVHGAGGAARDDGHAPDQPRRALHRPHRGPRPQRRGRAVRSLRDRVGPHRDRRRDPPPHRRVGRVRQAHPPARRDRPHGRRRRHRARASTSAASSRTTARRPCSPSRRPTRPPPTRPDGSGSPGSTPAGGTGSGSSAARRAPPPSPSSQWQAHDTTLTGRELDAVGLRPPVQYPQRSTVIELVAQN